MLDFFLNNSYNRLNTDTEKEYNAAVDGTDDDEDLRISKLSNVGSFTRGDQVKIETP